MVALSDLSTLPSLQDNQPTPPSLEILLLFSFVDHGRTQNEIGIKKAGQSKKSANLFMKLETIKNTQDSGTASQLGTEVNHLTPSCHSSLFPKKKQPLNHRFLSLICKAMMPLYSILSTRLSSVSKEQPYRQEGVVLLDLEVFRTTFTVQANR